MAIKKRSGLITMAATTGTVSIGLGDAYARIVGYELKGDDADVNAAATLAIVDRDARIILKAVTTDAGTDDATLKYTEQTYSTVGIRRALANNEAEAMGQDGVLTTDNVGAGSVGVIARSPVSVNIANGTSGDVYKVHLFVEV